MRRAPVLRSLTTNEGKNTIEALLVLHNLETKIKFCFIEGTQHIKQTTVLRSLTTTEGKNSIEAKLSFALLKEHITH